LEDTSCPISAGFFTIYSSFAGQYAFENKDICFISNYVAGYFGLIKGNNQ